MSKHLLNSPETLVLDSLRGVEYLNPAVALDIKNKILYQKDLPKDKVAVLSGGGSGHEPAHASFVGPGMLTAAVAGSIFASPNVSQIRSAIRHVERDSSGTLLVVKNYTGDVLHFGLAVEQHRATSQKDTRMIVVGDDVAVGKKQGSLVGRRGLAGTVLVYKVAGALAQRGGSLDQVEGVARYVADNVATFGVGLEHTHVPGTEASSSHLANDEVELGMGIHNEPGNSHLKPYPPLKDLLAQMLTSLTSTSATDPDRGFLEGLKGDGKDEVVLMVNNLGGISVLELGGVVKEAVEWLHAEKFIVRRVLSGTYMTSLSMPGISLTLLLLPRDGQSSNITSTSILELVDAPAEVPGWVWHAAGEPSIESAHENNAVDVASLESEADNGPILKASNPSEIVSGITRAAKAVIAAEPEITKQDQIAGDGDAGTTLKQGAEGVLKAIDAKRITGKNVIADMLAISSVVDEDMGGTSGALYSIFFSGLATSLRQQASELSSSESTITPEIWIKSAADALQVLYKYTRARPPSRTLVDPLDAFVQSLTSSSSSPSFEKALKEADAAARETAKLVAKAGRGAYVDQDELAKSETPDPGAWGVKIILEALLKASQ